MAAGPSLKGSRAQVSARVAASTFPGGRAALVSLFPAPSHAPWLRPTREPRPAPRGFVTEPCGQSRGHGGVGFQPCLLGRVGPLRLSLSSRQPRHRPRGSWRDHKAQFCWFPTLLLPTRAFRAVVPVNSAATSSLPHSRDLDPGTRDSSLPCAFVCGGSIMRRQRPRLKHFDKFLHRASPRLHPQPSAFLGRQSEVHPGPVCLEPLGFPCL